METQYLGGRRREKTKIGNEAINSLFPIKVHEAKGGGTCSLGKAIEIAEE